MELRLLLLPLRVFLNLKTYYLSVINSTCEENFSGYHSADQLIAYRDHYYSAALDKEYGTAPAGTGSS